MVKTPLILSEAHRYSCAERHADEVSGTSLLSKNRFQLLLCCMFYFSLLWDVFKGSKDEEVHSDSISFFMNENTFARHRDSRDSRDSGDESETEINTPRVSSS
jgi:hypothetical protein